MSVEFRHDQARAGAALEEVRRLPGAGTLLTILAVGSVVQVALYGPDLRPVFAYAAIILPVAVLVERSKAAQLREIEADRGARYRLVEGGLERIDERSGTQLLALDHLTPCLAGKIPWQHDASRGTLHCALVDRPAELAVAVATAAAKGVAADEVRLEVPRTWSLRELTRLNGVTALFAFIALIILAKALAMPGIGLRDMAGVAVLILLIAGLPAVLAFIVTRFVRVTYRFSKSGIDREEAFLGRRSAHVDWSDIKETSTGGLPDWPADKIPSPLVSEPRDVWTLWLGFYGGWLRHRGPP